MMDPLTLLYWLMALSWIIGLFFVILGPLTDSGEILLLGLMTWLLFSIPLTIVWAIVWVLVEALL